MSLKKKEFSYDKLHLNKEKIDTESRFTFEKYNNLITDWSGIYLEFIILKRIKPILINSKMKVGNDV